MSLGFGFALPAAGASLSAANQPSLNFDFVGSGTLDSRITFSRGTNATMYDSTGTLVWAPNNMLTYSEQFNNAAWSPWGSIVISADTVVAPDGKTTADTLTGSLIDTGVFRFSTTVSGTPYTASVYVKNISGATAIKIGCDAHPSNAFVTVNAATGTVTSAGAGVTSYAMTDAGNGWYRVSITFTPTTTAPSFVIYGTTGASISWAVWGAQLNIGALQPYYPTTSAAYYGPRFDYNPSTLAPQGLLIEEQRTNSIRNNTMQGAVAGTPGTMPTNWLTFISPTGITRTIVGAGTENGITYIDIKFSGTPSAAGVITIQDEANNAVAALTGQTWTHSVFLSLAAGSTAGVSSVFTVFEERTSGNVFVAEQNSSAYSLSAGALNALRQSKTGTLSGGATTAFLNAYFKMSLTGAAIDITLRIGLPQLEQGAFATSVIPTTTAAATRNADVATMTGTNFSSWYNASEGTFYAEAALTSIAARNGAGFDVNDGAVANNRIIFRAINPALFDQVVVRSGGAIQAVLTSNAGASVLTTRKSAIAYKVNDFAFAAAGTTPATASSGAVPVSPNKLFIGSADGGTEFLGGWIRRISYYPTRLPNATLQSITA